MQELKFQELNLSHELQRAVQDMGFEEATPIQAQTIPLILSGKDIIGQSQTGTGKTAAFGLPILEMVDPSDKTTQAFILCPTRELAIQVSEELRRLSKYKHGIKILPVYGGQPIERQIKALKEGIQIIIGTPGRIMDHMDRRTIKLGNVKIVVLDEADEMLDMGFREDIETILTKVPEIRQTVLFSATMPKPIIELTKNYQNNPAMVKVSHTELTVPKIEQYYYEVKEKTKAEVLTRLIDVYDPKLSIVFCNTKKRVDELVSELQLHGYSAEGIHGDMKQVQRDRVMSKFRNGTVEILIATDVAARGIDVDDVEAVFNYDLPQDEEYYVHRIGRTGRAGRAGRSFSFVVGKDIYKLKDIQRYSKAKIILQPVPSVGDVEEIKANSFLEKVKEVVNEGHLTKYVNYVEKLIGEDFTSIDLAAALIKMSIGTDAKSSDVNNFTQEDYGDTGAAPGMVKLFINAGKIKKISVKDIVGSIAANTGLSKDQIGNIKLLDNFSFVEIPTKYVNDVIMVDDIKGTRVHIEVANRKN